MTESGPMDLINNDNSDAEDGVDKQTRGNLGYDLPGALTNRGRPIVRTKCLRIAPTGRSFAAATTEGVQVYSIDDSFIFDPTDLDIDVTPEMGNCLIGGMGDPETELGATTTIIVTNTNGGIMEFCAPITAGSITTEFLNHAIFPSRDLFWKPLFPDENLVPGNSYHLLPLNNMEHTIRPAPAIGHTRSSSSSSLVTAAYRMSFDYHAQGRGMFKRSYTQVFNNKKGYWKVKLVISPEQLREILSQENRTEELIESVRTVAKCGESSSVSVGASILDQWSLSNSSSRSNSTKNDILLEF